VDNRNGNLQKQTLKQANSFFQHSQLRISKSNKMSNKKQINDGGALPNEEWETAETGQFETVNLVKEGDTWTGKILGLTKPDYIPEGFDDNCFETENEKGERGIIPNYWALKNYIDAVGYGEGVIFRIIRGSKVEKEKGRSFVNFTIQHRILNAKKIVKV